MTWFKVDDGLHKHRKRVRVGVSVEGFAAMGLWSVAGSWASDELTDGWIPDDVVEYLAPVVGQDLAKRLEKAGLWERVTRDDEEGWQFHDWTDQNPTKEQVLAERAAAAARQQRARERAKEKREQAEKAGQDDDASRRDSRVTNGGSHGGVTAAVTVPPTRPDPTRPEVQEQEQKQTSEVDDDGDDEDDLDDEPDTDPKNDRDDINLVCQHLSDRIVGNGSKRPTIGKRWRNSARLMIDRDKRTVEQILKAIDWCQDDEFWRGNVLSMPKLRKQYDALRLAAQRRRNANGGGPPVNSGANKHMDSLDRKPTITGVIASEAVAEERAGGAR